jgi:hypothetical protein
MARFERVREAVNAPLHLEYFTQRAATGWKLVAMEWERELPGDEPQAPSKRLEPVPYGLRVAEDCQHLEEHPLEMEVLSVMMELIVRDFTLSRLAAELNRREFRTRDGAEWSALSVFKTLPRVIEVAPQVHSSDDWAERRKQLQHIAWNS